MACCMPLKSRNLNVNILVLKPTVVVDEVVEALKHFTSWSITFGCIHNAILQTIHGNKIIWYGAWMKRSQHNQNLLDSALMIMLRKISVVADIIDNNFFEPCGGESKHGFLAARFSTGDTVSFTAIPQPSHDDASQIDLPYAVNLATFQSRFLTMDGATSVVCLKRNHNNSTNDKGGDDCILNFFVWESLESCYSYIMKSDMKGMSLPLKHDIFRVIYVGCDKNNVLKFEYSPWPPHFMFKDDREQSLSL